MYNKVFRKKTLRAINLVLALLLVLSSCSTKKNTVLTRTYHNVNAKYNVYFNGTESFKKGVKSIEDSYKDNYTRVLPIYIFGDKEQNGVASGDMDNCIKKTAKLINKHSITARPKHKSKTIRPSKQQKEFENRPEYNYYVDDSYMLMAKAQLYKHDFNQAVKTLKYVEQTYEKEMSKYRAMLWIVRAYCESPEYANAKNYLDLIEADKKFPKELKKKELQLTYADFYIKQELYDQAIPYLKKAITAEKKRKAKARYQFILAQIYQQSGDTKKASDMYTQVIKTNPPYEMTFNAQINRAICYSGKGSEGLIDELKKMLKDEKNSDYKDQIYFALANIAYKAGEMEDAMAYFQQSVQTSVNNFNQKAVSCLALADIYFGKKQYQMAQAYYDTTIMHLDKNYPGYVDIALKTNYLTDLVTCLGTIEREDSLQRWALMDEKERNAKIDEIIQTIKEDEQRKAEEERMNMTRSSYDMQEYNQDLRDMQNVKGKWYFYNPSLVSMGASKFAQKWGKRKLEDNWRRSNKSIVMDAALIDSISADSSERVFDNKSKEYYTQDLPLTDSLMRLSHESIIDAYMKAGRTYYEKLKDYDKAIETFSELIRRYPDNVYVVEVLYILYQIYELKGDMQESNRYKNEIISKFPQSKYAKLFTNPNYLSELREIQRKVEALYDIAYTDYKIKNYPAVLSQYQNVLQQYPDNELMPKFMYLNALSIGATQSPNTEQLKKALEELVVKYPDSEIKNPAMATLRLLGGISEPEVVFSEQEIELYKFERSAPHFYVVAVKRLDADLNRMKFEIEKYNLENFEVIEFNVSVADLDKDVRIITVKTINGKESALNYLEAIKDNQKVFGMLNSADYEQFVISSDNFTALFEDKNLSKYRFFYKKNYQN